jgi:hypothetical protein
LNRAQIPGQTLVVQFGNPGIFDEIVPSNRPEKHKTQKIPMIGYIEPKESYQNKTTNLNPDMNAAVEVKIEKPSQKTHFTKLGVLG